MSSQGPFKCGLRTSKVSCCCILFSESLKNASKESDAAVGATSAKIGEVLEESNAVGLGNKLKSDESHVSLLEGTGVLKRISSEWRVRDPVLRERRCFFCCLRDSDVGWLARRWGSSCKFLSAVGFLLGVKDPAESLRGKSSGTLSAASPSTTSSLSTQVGTSS